MSLKQRITKMRRDYWRDRVLDIGPKLDRLYRRQAALNPVLNPDLVQDVELTLARIDHLERKRDGYLDKIRRTA